MTHAALFTWKPGTSDQQVEELAAALATLPELIPEIRAFRLGVDAGVSVGNDRFAVVAEFDDVEAYQRYASDPRHRAMIDGLLKPILGTRHAVQFEDRASP
ncbi:MAG TPA: Dabb family protein [Acidimicrobiales bacterium]|nr:Dabb family protein [Acidimicrobiales bacterium]